VPSVDQSRREQISTERIRGFRTRILGWYSENGRNFPWRQSPNTYHRIVAEVLLQRTRAGTVAIHFPAFIKNFPCWASLSNASYSRIKKVVVPLGLWRTRTITLRKLATQVTERGGHFPESRSKVAEFTGVGQYIGNAVSLFCFGTRLPLLDVNMARVLERYFGPRKLADIRYDPYLQRLARRLVQTKRAADLNWAILDFGALVCRSQNPKCSECPLKSQCKFRRRFRQKALVGVSARS
jgi:A/G-specific adenine glycosylase